MRQTVLFIKFLIEKSIKQIQEYINFVSNGDLYDKAFYHIIFYIIVVFTGAVIVLDASPPPHIYFRYFVFSTGILFLLNFVRLIIKDQYKKFLAERHKVFHALKE